MPRPPLIYWRLDHLDEEVRGIEADAVLLNAHRRQRR
jgi:hypothetical protein